MSYDLPSYPDSKPTKPEQYQKFIEAVLGPDFSHCSKREFCMATIVHAYRKEPASPSGVHLAASLCVSDDNVALAIVKGLGVMPNYTGPQRGDLAMHAHG